MYREYAIGHRRLKIFLGDITDLAVDALVNSENSDLIMDRVDGPSVSAAIRRRAGPTLPEELAALGPVELGKAVITGAGGSLKCRHIVHAAVVRKTGADTHETEPTALRKAVRSALELANACGLRSLAFPAFGVRAAQVPREVSSDLMIEEVMAALHRDGSVEEVIFALLDPESFLVFFERAILRHAEFTAPIELQARSRPEGIEFRLAEGEPVVASEISRFDEAGLEDLGKRFRSLQSAAQRRLGDAPTLLRSLGAFLWNFVLPRPIRERLSDSKAANLLLRLDERLQGLPLELAWDGRSTLHEQFRIARQIAVQGGVARDEGIAGEDHVTLICDTLGDLPGAHAEAVRLFRLFSEAGIPVDLRGGPRATRAAVYGLLAETRLLHFSGHGRACTRDGHHAWILADGDLRPEELLGARTRPALVFSNACAREENGGLLGEGRLALGQAFLRNGARHFVGTLWEVDDRASRHFAVAFYEALLQGRDMGDALRSARAALRESGGRDAIDWAAYVHFGNPRHSPIAPRSSGRLRRMDPALLDSN